MTDSGLILKARYRLDRRIAAGSMGEVWQGIDLLLKRQVAVKLIRPDHAGDAEGLARFRAESRHAASLAHPNIVQVFDYGEPDPPDLGYLVMEFVRGPSLADRLRQGPLDLRSTLTIVAQAARGLQAAHQARLVHRDIKPANLLLSPDGLVKVTDFGIAYAMGSTPVTQAGMVMGTPLYLAPERAVGAPATPASDLYALGVVAYQCVTGRVPFEGEPLAVAFAHVEAGIPALPPWVPAEVARLVGDLTARDPSARPADAAEAAARAEHLLALLCGPAADAVSSPAGGAASAFSGATEGLTLHLPRRAAPAQLSSPLGRTGHAGRTGRPADAGKIRAAGRTALSRRTALPVGGLAVAGVTGWLLATMPGPTAVHGPAAAPAVTSGPARSPSAAAPRPQTGSHRSGPGDQASSSPRPVEAATVQAPAAASAASPPPAAVAPALPPATTASPPAVPALPPAAAAAPPAAPAAPAAAPSPPAAAAAPSPPAAAAPSPPAPPGHSQPNGKAVRAKGTPAPK